MSRFALVDDQRFAPGSALMAAISRSCGAVVVLFLLYIPLQKCPQQHARMSGVPGSNPPVSGIVYPHAGCKASSMSLTRAFALPASGSCHAAFLKVPMRPKRQCASSLLMPRYRNFLQGPFKSVVCVDTRGCLVFAVGCELPKRS